MRGENRRRGEGRRGDERRGNERTNEQTRGAGEEKRERRDKER